MSMKETTREFFEAYDRRDVEAMAALAAEDATFEYVPLGDEGKGPLHEVGVGTWSALVDVFPDIHNEVEWITEDENGDAFARVFIGGTQEKELWGIPSQGESFWLDHLFILRGNDADEITEVVSYWDKYSVLEQLGAL